jgi:hypothetical protein
VVRVLDDDRSCRKVTEALASSVYEHHDEADTISVREEVHDSDHVANSGLHEGQRLAAVADRAEPEDLLAKGLTRPGAFADPEVSEDNHKAAEQLNERGDCVRADRGTCRDAGQDDHDQDPAQDEQVDNLGDGARAQARDLVVERNTLGGGDHEVGVWERMLHVGYFAVDAR